MGISRIIMDFTASGALIGYAAGYTLWGISLGASLGLSLLIVELFCIKKKI